MPKQSPNEPGEIAPGTVVDGRYKVVRSIGQGGNGLVYEVEHVRTGRRLALKALLDETGFARLEQEARAASLMKNGHTARIVDMEAGGPAGAYMVMELLEGQSLRALLDEAGQLPLELTANIAMSGVRVPPRGARPGHHPPRFSSPRTSSSAPAPGPASTTSRSSTSA